jgi:predicted glycosyltransferase
MARVLFDVSHPAHVHQFAPVARSLAEGGADVLMLGRDKDVTVALLERTGLPFEVLPIPPGVRTWRRDGLELTHRTAAIRRHLTRGAPCDVLLTRNPSGVLAGLGTRTWTVFDTDDGRSVGLHYRLAAPFADVVTTSVHDPEQHGRGTRRYRGFKALAFLHPDVFRPDPEARAQWGIPAGALFIVRFSAHAASHDRGVRGLHDDAKQRLLTLLRAHGSVVLSEEGRPPRLLADRPRDLPADALLDLLADATLCVGDSQSVAAEAALLGVPTLRLSSFTGRSWYLQVLEERYGLVRNFRDGEDEALLAAVETTLRDLDAVRGRARTARTRLVTEHEDVGAWFVQLVHELVAARKPRRPVPVRATQPLSAPLSA